MSSSGSAILSSPLKGNCPIREVPPSTIQRHDSPHDISCNLSFSSRGDGSPRFCDLVLTSGGFGADLDCEYTLRIDSEGTKISGNGFDDLDLLSWLQSNYVSNSFQLIKVLKRLEFTNDSLAVKSEEILLRLQEARRVNEQTKAELYDKINELEDEARAAQEIIKIKNKVKNKIILN